MSLAIISQILQTGANDLRATTNGIRASTKEGLRWCSISKNEIAGLPSTMMNSTFRGLSGIDQGRTLQIAGDSLPAYDQAASMIVRESMQSLINGSGISCVIYGLTGKVDVNGWADINHLVNRWLDDEPEIRSNHTWGVVTDVGTFNAVSLDGYSFSDNCANFIVVDGGASFGDETPFTDAITDVLLIAEGGVQSFRQAVNVLSRPGTVVHAYLNLRHENCTPRFSAARFLAFVKKNANHISPDLLEQFCLTISLSNSQLKQLEAAWLQFQGLHLANRIPDIIFHYR